jgi:UDP-N-acetylmuramate dehydrogenase
MLTRACERAGRAGLEFGVGIPGSVGGWLRMNAGTREREVKDAALRVSLAGPDGGVRELAAHKLEWHYRALELPPGTLVLGAHFATRPGDPVQIRAAQTAQLASRRATQPVNQPSCGSVFKNPPGEHAGRLIDAAGLKGSRAGGAEISPLHANFIVTRSGARAADVLELIARAREQVGARFGVALETEVQIVGEDP